MDRQDFMIEVEAAFLRSKRILNKKADQYALGRDRLEQFHRAGAAQDIGPAEALLGMATKHYTSIADMCKNPTSYNLKVWREKLNDLRNYTFLLEALLKDLGVE